MRKNVNVVKTDLVIAGAGMPGICAAVQAARLGLTVALVNSRGHLGGNAGAEFGLRFNGADGSQEYNFFSRETGIIEEIRLENLYRNPQGNRYIWDTVLLDLVRSERNISLYMNTNIDNIEMSEDGKKIVYVSGTQYGSGKSFDFYGKCFMDNTGDGTVGFLAGAEFRMGREAKSEFGERIAPEEADDHVIPSTMIFNAKDTGRPVKYIAPKFAMDINKTDILQYREIPEDTFYNSQWWYAIGGNHIDDFDDITQKHRELVYGVWDYIKNSGKYKSENYDLDYVSSIPAKRESRRLMGDYILTENDIVEQRDFEDVVGYGGWSIDLHDIDGFLGKELKNKHFMLKGIYHIPLRTGYSKDIDNLFIAGRCMSVTHVALGSTRVMATLCTLGQAQGAAAYLCIKHGTSPRGVYEHHINELQQLLLKHDHSVIGKFSSDNMDKARLASIEVSSVKKCSLSAMKTSIVLEHDTRLYIPVRQKTERISLLLKSEKDTKLEYSVYLPGKKENYYPSFKVLEAEIDIKAAEDFEWRDVPVSLVEYEGYVIIELSPNKFISVGAADTSLQGVVCTCKKINRMENHVDIDTLETMEHIWSKLQNTICFKVYPLKEIFGAENINNGHLRPHGLPNLWVSDGRVQDEYIRVKLGKLMPVSEVVIRFDTDLNFRIFNMARLHNFNAIPQVMKDYDVFYKEGAAYKLLKEVRGNYQRTNCIKFATVHTDEIKVVFIATNGSEDAAVYEMRVY